jgi:hypothetical protein
VELSVRRALLEAKQPMNTTQPHGRVIVPLDLLDQ